MTDYLHNNYRHTCNSLIISCIDFRFTDDIINWLKELELEGHYDLLAIAGASKNIANPEKSEYRELLLKNIDISVCLHKIEQIFLMHHEDCGAYGGKNAFNDSKKEHNHHIKEMIKSKQIIQNKYEKIDVIKVYVYQNGKIEIIDQ